jgi:hypothetical protein
MAVPGEVSYPFIILFEALLDESSPPPFAV